MQNKKLQQLQKLWDKKLAKAGFEDIEDKEGRLTYWHSHYFRNRFKDINDFHAKQEYFYLAEHFLNEYPFADDKEKAYWAKHAQGKSNREIAEKHRRPKKAVNAIIARLRKVMLAWKF